MRILITLGALGLVACGSDITAPCETGQKQCASPADDHAGGLLVLLGILGLAALLRARRPAAPPRADS